MTLHIKESSYLHGDESHPLVDSYWFVAPTADRPKQEASPTSAARDPYGKISGKQRTVESQRVSLRVLFFINRIVSPYPPNARSRASHRACRPVNTRVTCGVHMLRT